jgi:hypothetical protein
MLRFNAYNMRLPLGSIASHTRWPPWSIWTPKTPLHGACILLSLAITLWLCNLVITLHTSHARYWPCLFFHSTRTVTSVLSGHYIASDRSNITTRPLNVSGVSEMVYIQKLNVHIAATVSERLCSAFVTGAARNLTEFHPVRKSCVKALFSALDQLYQAMERCQ